MGELWFYGSVAAALLLVGITVYDNLRFRKSPPPPAEDNPDPVSPAQGDRAAPEAAGVSGDAPVPAPGSRRNVLVGSLSSFDQLSVCLRDNFYHIPASIAGKDYRDIEYVAIYQSRRFFGAAAGVRYYARVTSARVLPRYEIKEIPRSSNMLYVRFELEPWQVLDVPILPKGKGITSARTSYDRLTRAKNMNDLIK